MRRASRIVFNATADGPHELRTDATIIRYPEHYSENGGRRCGTACSSSWPSIGNRAVETEGVMRKKAEPFVKVPLWWIEETAKLTKSPTTLVLIFPLTQRPAAEVGSKP